MQYIPCPVCDFPFEEGDIQAHVDSHFSTIPDNPSSTSTTKHTDPDDATALALLAVKKKCPTCDSLIDEDLFQEHLDFHVAESMVYTDEDIVKKRPNEDEDTTNSNKRTSTNSSYRTQYLSGLSKLVNTGRISIPEYHSRRQKVMAEIPHDLVSDALWTASDGIIHQLRDLLSESCRSSFKTSTSTAFLCHPATFHIGGDVGDHGYGCGYRNFQMLITSLLNYANVAEIFRSTMGGSGGDNNSNDNINIPSIPTLQKAIEAAWKQGFDVEGGRQLNFTLLNTRKWIGTSEIAAVLACWGVWADIITFDKYSGDDAKCRGVGKHPKLLKWVWEYFNSSSSSSTSTSSGKKVMTHFFQSTSSSSTSPTSKKPKEGVHLTNLPPLYFQHNGHSRTIIGIEKLKNGEVNLLVFDPARRIPPDVKKMATDKGYVRADWVTGKAGREKVVEDEDGGDGDEDEDVTTTLSSSTTTGSSKPPTNAKFLRSFRVSSYAVSRHPQYQIVAVPLVKRDGEEWVPRVGYASEQERNNAKIFANTVIH